MSEVDAKDYGPARLGAIRLRRHGLVVDQDQLSHRFANDLMTSLSPARWMVCATLVIALVGSGCSKAPADEGSYYRMKVGLTYKGKPVDIDFVAGCNVHNGHDVSGGSIINRFAAGGSTNARDTI